MHVPIRARRNSTYPEVHMEKVAKSEVKSQEGYEEWRAGEEVYVGHTKERSTYSCQCVHTQRVEDTSSFPPYHSLHYSLPLMGSPAVWDRLASD